VAAHQRARLHAATIEACARKGYAATTAAEITTLAGVSKKTLYKYFESKDACFLATYDVIIRQAVARISLAYRGGGSGTEHDPAAGLCRAFGAFAAELVERPAPSRVALVDILALAPSAADRIDRAEAIFATMISRSLAQGSDGIAIPGGIVRALIGGVWFVARNRLSEGRPEAITASGAELGEWLLAYRSPAAARAPAGSPRRSVPGERRTGPAAPERDRRLEWLSADALAEALRASEGASSWESSVCRVVPALFFRIASDPVLARSAFVDAFAEGAEMVEQRAAVMRGFAEVLARRAPAGRRPNPVVAEAIVGSVWSIAHRYVVQGRRKMLPIAWTRAAFVAMAPIVGAEAALAAILAEEGAAPADPRPIEALV
jgi:AcrR family transcriptional regulator